METYIKKIKGYTVLLVGFILLMASCEKKDYLDEGGLSVAETPLTTYDYLAAHQAKLFDTLLLIVDHYELKDEINNSGTFYAPTDYSIKTYLTRKQGLVRQGAGNEDKVYGLSELYAEMPADSIKQYLFNEKISVSSLTTTPTQYISKGKTQALLSKVLQTDSQYYIWSSEPVYFLYYGRKVSPTATMINVQCQTTGILTKSGSGTILHVLRNTHEFISFTL